MISSLLLFCKFFIRILFLLLSLFFCLYNSVYRPFIHTCLSFDEDECKDEELMGQNSGDLGVIISSIFSLFGKSVKISCPSSISIGS